MFFLYTQPLRLLLLAAIFLLGAAHSLFAQVPAWQEAISPSRGEGYSTTVDAAGNLYVTGSFIGIATFGTTTLVSAGAADVFVAKRSPAGVWLWVTGAGGSSNDFPSGVAVDGSGNVVVTGYFTSPTISFGATTLTNAGRDDLFVAKLTPTGAWQWATSTGGGDYDYSNGVAVDGGGNVVITGYFTSSTLTFGATILTNTTAGFGDLFVAKLTPMGSWQWATGARGSDTDHLHGVAVDSSGSVVVTGDFSSPTLTLGSTTLNNVYAGRGDLFVAKLTPTGGWQWATGAEGTSYEQSTRVAVDGSGSIVVTGNFSSPTLVFGATTLTNVNAGFYDLFVAKLTPTGAWQWATSVGGNNYEYSNDVAVDGNGSVVITGSFSSPTLTFGATTLTNAGRDDLFVAKLTPTGSWQWATGAGGGGSDRSNGVAMDGSGSVVVTGTFEGPTITFGAITLTGYSALILARLSSVNGLVEDSEQEAPFTLTPNPARTTVQLTGAPGATATLLDGLGRLVGTSAISPAGTATLDACSLPAGLYLVRVGKSVRRLMVE